MSTNGADDPKPINPGEIITAAWLNSTRGPGTILGADGVQVSRAGNRLAIATTSTHKTPPVAAVPGTIASEQGSGEYTWTRVGSGEGPASGTATEATGATGIAVGTKITLHRTTGGLWWFYNAAASPQIGCHVKHVASIAAGSFGYVSWTSTVYDRGTLLDAGDTTRFVIATAGVYRISVQGVFYKTNAVDDIVRFDADTFDSLGAPIDSIPLGGGDLDPVLMVSLSVPSPLGGGCEVELDVGDRIKISVGNTNGSAVTSVENVRAQISLAFAT